MVLGKRMVGESGVLGFCRRGGHPYQRWCERVGDGDGDRSTQRVWTDRNDAEPLAILVLRGGLDVGGLVRIYGYVRSGIDGDRHGRVCRHSDVGCRGCADIDGGRWALARQDHRLWTWER